MPFFNIVILGNLRGQFRMAFDTRKAAASSICSALSSLSFAFSSSKALNHLARETSPAAESGLPSVTPRRPRHASRANWSVVRIIQRLRLVYASCFRGR